MDRAADINELPSGHAKLLGCQRVDDGDRSGGGGNQGIGTGQACRTLQKLTPGFQHSANRTSLNHGGLWYERGGRRHLRVTTLPLPKVCPGFMGLSDRCEAGDRPHLGAQGVDDADLVHGRRGLLIDHPDSARAMLPVKEGTGGFLQQADRQDNVSPGRNLGKALLDRNDEPAILDSLAGSGRVGHIGQLYARNNQRVELSGLGGSQHSAGVKARLGWQVTGSPRGRDIYASLGIVDETPTWQQLRQQTSLDGTNLASSTRHPGHPNRRVKVVDGRQGTGPGSGPLPHQHDGSLPNSPVGDQLGESLGLLTGQAASQLGSHLRRAIGQVSSDCSDRHLVPTPRLTQAQEDHRALVLRLQGHQDYPRSLLKVGVGDRLLKTAPGDSGTQIGGLLSRVWPGTEVDVVGAEHDSSKPGPGQARLHREASTGEDADASTSFR